MKFFFQLLLFTLFIGISYSSENELSNAKISELDIQDCSSQSDDLCHYYQSKKFFLTTWHSIDEKDNFEELKNKAKENLEIFIQKIDNKSVIVKSEVHIDTITMYARILWYDLEKYDEFQEMINYVYQVINMGETYNSWRLCDYKYNYYEEYSRYLTEQQSKELIDTAMIDCKKFIEEDSSFPRYDEDHILGEVWDESAKEQHLFNIYMTQANLYESLYNSSESFKNSLLANEIAENKKYEWLTSYEDLIPLNYLSLGVGYWGGYGTNRNANLGILNLEKSAELGSSFAMSVLGEIYFEGEYGFYDLDKSRKYFEEATSIYDLNLYTLKRLGEYYLYGFGVEKDYAKAKGIFIKIQNTIEKIKQNDKDEFAYSFIEYAETFSEPISRLLNSFEDDNYIPKYSVICDDVWTAVRLGYNTSHLIQACREDANNNSQAAMIQMIEFHRRGSGIPKNTDSAYQLSQELIELINKDEFENTIFTDFFTDKADYETSMKNSKIFLNGQIALSIFNGLLKDKKPSEAYQKLKEYLFINELPANTEDSWYAQDWYMFISMKIEGWGTKKDLKGAEELLNILIDNYTRLSEDPIQIEDGYAQGFLDNIPLLTQAKDKLNQSKSGFAQRSNLITKFPAVYKGQAVWTSVDEVLGISTQSILMEIKSVKRIGYKNYLLKATLKYDFDKDGGTYLLSGILDEETKLIKFEEFNSGDTNYDDYVAGNYYGKFKDNFANFDAQLVTANGYHASIELFRDDVNTKSVNYKNELGIKKQYAIVIGNNHYENLSHLETASTDARSLADVLEKKYGFEVEEPLINATRNDILIKLSHMTKVLNEDDSLLIFYAGHGRQDNETGRGYWSPVDAFEDNYINDISNDDITNILKKLDSKHILVIADSCYSGSLVLRSSDIINRKDISYLRSLVQKNSRKAMTSGALQPVSDTGANGHSAFANSLLLILTQNEFPITASDLHSKIRPTIMSEFNQTPLYNVVGNAGDQGGEFIFVPIQ
tara:strand:- start:3223 stop:6210 length:2988 start_codon:yes stop_codon:yes gene_type:complete